MKRYEENWVTVRKPGNVAEIMRRFGISDVFARLLWNRGYCTGQDVAGFLYPDGACMAPPVRNGHICAGDA